MQDKIGQLVDLTHPIKSGMPHWPGDPQTVVEPVAKVGREGYGLNRIVIGEHSGTHVGAPRHFYDEGKDISQIPVDRLLCPGVRISVRNEALNNPDFMLLPEHISSWQVAFSQLPSHSFVLIETGWSRFWNTPEVYFGMKSGRMHFPGVSKTAAELLTQSYQVAGIGIDTAGIDGGLSADFAANKILAANDGLHLENLTNLDLLPAKGFSLFIGALPIETGSGSPCRVIAMLAET